MTALHAHPRHAVLAALVAGLLLRGGAVALVLAAVVLAAAAASGAPRLAAGAALAVLVGAGIADARIVAIDAAALPATAGAVRARATILEAPRPRADGTLHARASLTPGGTAVVAVHPHATDAAPALGDVVAITGSARPLGPGDAHQRLRGARAVVDVESWTPLGRRSGLAGRLDGVRRRAEAALARGVDPVAGALARGMVLGQDEGLTRPVREDFERSGLAHLLAVSGQNVMLLCLLVFGVAAVAGLPFRARLLVALASVAVYVPLVGAGASIQRAGVMGAAGLVATLAGRPGSRWYAVGLAAAVTLGLNPRAAAEPGWQLSFAAVVGLLAWAAPLRAVLTRARCPRPLAEVAAVTSAATVATAPLLALHFEQVSVVSLPANLIAAPAVAPLMWLGMLASALAQVSAAAAAPVAWLCAPFVAFVAGVARAAAEPGWASATVGVGAGAVVAAYVVAVAVTLAGPRVAPWAGRHAAVWEARRAARRAPRARTALPAATLAAAIAVLLLVRPETSAVARGETVVSFLDVGQGDATLVQRGNTAVLFDTGPPDGPILRRLSEAGVERLDALVLTHAQADHEGAAPDVLARVPTRMVVNGGAGWPSPVQRRLPRDALPAYAGQRIALGALQIRVLWPPPGLPTDGDPNSRALVAHVRVDGFDLLLPADAESDVTARLDLPDVDALKVAHHGSEDAGLPALLDRTTPRVAAIEVGRDNEYGHPAPSTLAALASVPDVVRTDRDGTVRLHVAGDEMWLER